MPDPEGIEESVSCLRMFNFMRRVRLIY